MRIIIAGGRDFIPTMEHETWLINKLKELGTTEVACGMARGADSFGYTIAKKLGLTISEFPADWNKFGKSAGYKRNKLMAENADSCILFPGGKGTEHMKNLALEYNLIVISYEE